MTRRNGRPSQSAMSEDSTTTVAGRKSPRGESGQALVEFVIALPLLVLMIFAVIEFGLLYSHHITLTDATRVGARTAAVSRRTCPGNTEQAVRDSASTLDQSALEVEISPCPWS